MFQSQKGMTIVEAVGTLSDDEKAERMFIDARWPDGVACPKCGSVDIKDQSESRKQPFRCRDCRKEFSARTGTLLHGSNLSYSKWALAIYLLATSNKGISSIRMARDIGVTQKTAWHLAHRIREAWASGDDPMFAGPVEFDETYVGGREGRRHAEKKLKKGNFAAKTTLVGAKDRATGHVKTAVVDSPDTKNLVDFVHSTVEDKFSTTVYTDGAAAYYHVWSFRHGVVEHSTGQYVDGDVHTNSIESFWSMIKRGIMGVYHYVSPKHTHRYALEFEGRNNSRMMDAWDQIKLVMSGLDGKHLPYRKLVGRRGHSLALEHRGMTQVEIFRHEE